MRVAAPEVERLHPASDGGFDSGRDGEVVRAVIQGGGVGSAWLGVGWKPTLQVMKFLALPV